MTEAETVEPQTSNEASNEAREEPARGDAGPALAPRERAELARAILARVREHAGAILELSGVDASGPRAVAAWVDGPVRVANGLAAIVATLEALGDGEAPDAESLFVWNTRVAVRLAPPGFVTRTLHRGLESFAVLDADVKTRAEARLAAAIAPGEPRARVDAAVDPAGAIVLAARGALVHRQAVDVAADERARGTIERVIAPLVERGLARVELVATTEAPIAPTPIVVAPHLYSRADLELLARAFAAELAVARACAPPLLLTSRAWPQRDLLLELLTKETPLDRVASGLSAADAIARAKDGSLLEVPLIVERGSRASFDTTPATFVDHATRHLLEAPGDRALVSIVAPSGLDDDDPLALALDRAERQLPHRVLAIGVLPLAARALGDWALFDHVEKVLLRAPLVPFPRPLHLGATPRGLALARGLALGRVGALGLFAARA